MEIDSSIMQRDRIVGVYVIIANNNINYKFKRYKRVLSMFLVINRSQGYAFVQNSPSLKFPPPPKKNHCRSMHKYTSNSFHISSYVSIIYCIYYCIYYCTILLALLPREQGTLSTGWIKVWVSSMMPMIVISLINNQTFNT